MITIASLLFLALPVTSPLALSGANAHEITVPVAAIPVGGAPGIFSDDEEEEKPDKREEIKAALKELKGHIGKRGKEDAQAIAIIDTMLEEFPKSGAKDRKDIVKGLSGCFKQKRKPTKEGVIDNKLFIAAAAAMGRMGPESVKALVTWAGHKNFSKDYVAKRAIILAIGNTEHDDGIDALVDLLPHHEPQVQAAAAEGLQNYAGKKSKVRKMIFKEVLDEITRVKNSLDVNQTDQIVRQRYDAIAGPMLRTLSDLSGHESTNPMEFRKWWNSNKKRDWDKEEKGKDA